MTATRPLVYWHRDLPPLDAEIMDHGDGWDACHASLMAHVAARLEQEVARLGGDYAHVVDEHVDSRRDDLTTESWLHGRFSYVLYRRGPARA
jgi:hypothetical protein